MPPTFTLNEIRSRALAFAKEWKGATSEAAEKQTFWNEFFGIFGIRRRRVASFEVPVQLRDGHHGKIDLFWRSLLLVEHKSAGADLDAAFTQAAKYFEGIPDEDLPKYVLVSDFGRFRLYDLDDQTHVEFALTKLHDNIAALGFLTGHTSRKYTDAPQANLRAVRHMASLHDALKVNGYTGHPLAVFLVRLLFCLFADHTGLFPRNVFRDLIDRRTRPDGSDAGSLLHQVFAVLDTPQDARQRNLDEDLASLPYVNGNLFAERFDAPAFDTTARTLLLRCSSFDWSGVSPAIFGSMFQMVMDEETGKRRKIGAHYTSEKNILKVVLPALIDDLRAEFDRASGETALRSLLHRVAAVTVLDPACGCGNFLVIAYRELRQLEIDIWRRLRDIKKRDERLLRLDFRTEFTSGINVDAMFGIEVEEFPCRIAETALYLIDHMMNVKASEEFGENFIRLPLSKAPHIVNGNALRLDWSQVIDPARLSCIVGNPPFVGKKARSPEQVTDMSLVFSGWAGAGELDYVSAWYVKALATIHGTAVPVAFVSTNSLTQGEQVGILWPRLFRDGIKIHFAHRTFRWSNDAPGEAAVYCVIVGWGLQEPRRRLLFDYDSPQGEPLVREARHINAYLIDFDDVFVEARRTPLCPAPSISFGSMPNDAGNFLFDDAEYRKFLGDEPGSEAWFRPFISAREFIHGTPRWCLWLKDAPPSVVRSLQRVRDRVERVRAYRERSKRPATKKLAQTPTLFGEIRQPETPFIVIPCHSSEHRRFIPMAIVTPEEIVNNSCVMVRSEDLYDFGILQSTMHMAWMRQVCGRLESRYRYSIEIVYNNFPWPIEPGNAKRDTVRQAASGLLAVRAGLTDQSLADLYDVDVMPVPLLEAHRDLDRAVDRCYRSAAFDSELLRVQYLFGRYAELAAAGQPRLIVPARRRVPRRSRG